MRVDLDYVPSTISVFLNNIARGLDELLARFFGTSVGFFLLVIPFEEEGSIANYVSNAKREDVCSVMIEYIGKQDPKLIDQMLSKLQAISSEKNNEKVI